MTVSKAPSGLSAPLGSPPSSRTPQDLPDAADPPTTEHDASRMSMPRWLAFVIFFATIAAGVVVAFLFVKTKPIPQKKPRAESVLPVEVEPVVESSRTTGLALQGEVMPSRSMVVIPEVEGRVIWQSERLVPGGRIEKGEPLVRIDPRDLQLQLDQQRSQVASNQLTLQLEAGRSEVAKKEWELFIDERKKAGLPLPKDDDRGRRLALRKPQVNSAKIGVRSARSAMALTQLKLSRTTIAAPFNALVKAEATELGQVVSRGMQLATLIGTDTFWVQVSVPLDKLAYVRLPRGDSPGSEATITMDTGTSRAERKGHVIRLLGDLDPVGRLARILIEVDDPLMLTAADGDKTVALADRPPEGAPPDHFSSPELPLLLGSFVNVELEGITIDDARQIPRRALRENDEVFVLANGQLAIKKVDVLWSNADVAVVRGDLRRGEKVVTSAVNSPVAGMKLRAVKMEAGSKPEADEQRPDPPA
ncbi:MAG: HlyD family efflux transporter periplasmic adaptor subunit, partial [Myxococcota bacterium]